MPPKPTLSASSDLLRVFQGASRIMSHAIISGKDAQRGGVMEYGNRTNGDEPTQLYYYQYEKPVTFNRINTQRRDIRTAFEDDIVSGGDAQKMDVDSRGVASSQEGDAQQERISSVEDTVRSTTSTVSIQQDSVVESTESLSPYDQTRDSVTNKETPIPSPVVTHAEESPTSQDDLTTQNKSVENFESAPIMSDNAHTSTANTHISSAQDSIASAAQTPVEQETQSQNAHKSTSPTIEHDMNQHDIDTNDTTQTEYIPLRERKLMGNARSVPASSLGRAWGFGSLITKVAWNAATGSMLSGEKSIKKNLATEQNAQLIADTLCRMRGAALKLGQMISIQDSNMLPQPIIDAFERVRNQADYMPERQLRSVLKKNFGDNWETEVFSSFDMTPIAAASIGQVHQAVLRNGDAVAVKVQYPGVAQSMESDIRNLERLIKYTNILPRGAFVDSSIAQARYELSLECDYRIEAANQMRFASLIEQDPEYSTKMAVPKVYTDLSSEHVLVTEMVHDAWTLSDLAAKVDDERKQFGEPRIISQSKCDSIAHMILSLCLKEVFLYKFMQTDPNWSNFFYSPSKDKIYLIDFGACAEYPASFTNPYMQLVYGAAARDADLIIESSREMGFLTGEETSLMNNAHVQSAYIIGEPFQPQLLGTKYDFEKQEMTRKIQDELPVMLRHRLTPPPKLTYALHRKLSGAFLLCCKFGAKLDSALIFNRILDSYRAQHPELVLHATQKKEKVDRSAREEV